MTALANERKARVKKAGGMDYPVAASTLILKGARVVLQGGYLKNAVTAAAGTFKSIGRASDTVDNSAGADGALQCHVDFMKERTFFPWIGSAAEFVQADVGKVAYILDNQTVTTTATGRTATEGVVHKLETTNGVQTVWIEEV